MAPSRRPCTWTRRRPGSTGTPGRWGWSPRPRRGRRRAARGGRGSRRSGSAAPTPTSSSNSPRGDSADGETVPGAGRAGACRLARPAWCRGWCRGGRRTALAAQAGGWRRGRRPGRGLTRRTWAGRWPRPGPLFEHRAAAVGGSAAELTAALAGWRRDRWSPGWCAGWRAVRGRPAVVFPGQGAQRPGMGAGLYAGLPGVRGRRSTRCARCWTSTWAAPVADGADVVAGRGAGAWMRRCWTQAGLFAVEAALFALLALAGALPRMRWRGTRSVSWRRRYAAGVLSLEDACALVAARGRLMQALPAGGAMTAVAAPEEEVARGAGWLPGGGCRGGERPGVGGDLG